MISRRSPFTIGIAGPSGAGKSYLASALARTLAPAAVLSLDWYFCIPKDGIYANYWDIRCYDVRSFILALENLRNGHAINAYSLDYRDFTRTGTKLICPAPTIIAEGMALYRIQKIIEHINLPLFLNPPEAIAYQRKHQRDRLERNRSTEEIDQQWKWIVEEWNIDRKQLPTGVHIVVEADPFDAVCSLLSTN